MTDDSRFNQLLSAMVSKPALETPAKEAQTSNEDREQDYGETQTPKDKSATTFSKR